MPYQLCFPPRERGFACSLIRVMVRSCKVQDTPFAISTLTTLLCCCCVRWQGTTLLKYGRHGAPKYHHFRLSADDAELQWESKGVSTLLAASRVAW